MRRKDSKTDLEQAYKYYAKRLENYLTERAILKDSMHGYTRHDNSARLIKQQTYQELFTQGITRRESDGRVRRLKGEEAIRYRIATIKRNTSKTVYKFQFIENYKGAMQSTGFNSEQVRKVTTAMSKISSDKVSYIIRHGLLPQISHLYDPYVDHEDIFNDIMTSLSGDYQQGIRYERNRIKDTLFYEKLRKRNEQKKKKKK